MATNYGTELFANNAQTTLAGAISNTSLTVALSPGAGALFPNPTTGQFFRITFIDAATGLLHEIAYCTARSTDTLTIVRAQEGTTALSWNAGDTALNCPTAGAMGNLTQEIQIQQNLYNYAADTGTANSYIVTLNPASLANGVAGPQITFVPAHTNTGASTLTVNGGTSYPLVGLAHTALTGGELFATGYAVATFNATISSYVLLECTGGALQVAAATASQQAVQAGQVVSGSLGTATAAGTANAITASFAASPTAFVNGQPFTIISSITNTGAMTGVITLGGTAQSSVPIVKANNQPVAAGDYPAGYPGEFAYSASFGALVMNNPATGVAVLTGGSYASNSIVTASTTFTSANIGAAIEINSVSATANILPAASAFTSGKAISFSNIGAGIATFTRAGSDTITGGNLSAATAIPLNQGECVTLVSNGSNVWYVAASNVTFFGAPQAWVDVTGSRVAGTNYTNTTGRIKYISANRSMTGGGAFTITVSGFQFNVPNTGSGTATFSTTVPIPIGAVYSVNAFTQWLEM